MALTNKDIKVGDIVVWHWNPQPTGLNSQYLPDGTKLKVELVGEHNRVSKFRLVDPTSYI